MCRGGDISPPCCQRNGQGKYRHAACEQWGILKGVITDRDIVLRVLSSAVEKGVFPDDMSCGSIMTKDPVTVTPDTNIHDAALIFATRQVRRLPVIDNSKLVGILSLGDMALKPVLVDEAGDALSAISCPPGTQINK